MLKRNGSERGIGGYVPGIVHADCPVTLVLTQQTAKQCSTGVQFFISLQLY